MLPELALKRMIGACLDQVRGNAATVVDGRSMPEHIHQLRIGLRRLRSVLRLFGPWSSTPVAPWDPALRELSTALGAWRDQDVLRTELQPQLAALGAPPLRLARQSSPSRLRALFGVASFSGLMLELETYVNSPTPTAPDGKRVVADLARRRLKALEERLRIEFQDFPTASDAQRHRLRKRLKRLRYGIELAGDLLPGRKQEQALLHLKPLQDALGRYNDICHAQAALKRLAPSPGSWFARGWAAARRDQLLHEAKLAVARWREDVGG